MYCLFVCLIWLLCLLVGLCETHISIFLEKPTLLKIYSSSKRWFIDHIYIQSGLHTLSVFMRVHVSVCVCALCVCEVLGQTLSGEGKWEGSCHCNTLRLDYKKPSEWHWVEPFLCGQMFPLIVFGVVHSVCGSYEPNKMLNYVWVQPREIWVLRWNENEAEGLNRELSRWGWYRGRPRYGNVIGQSAVAQKERQTSQRNLISHRSISTRPPLHICLFEPSHTPQAHTHNKTHTYMRT